MFDCQYLYINASDENGIDTVRTKINQFAQSQSFDNKLKVVICDEIDGSSQESMRALRNTMEEYAGITRFILTANNRSRIIDALQSRCQFFDLTPTFDIFVKRCIHIVKKENITIKDEDRQKFLEFVKSFYPDIRKCINELQKNSTTGSLIFKTHNIDDTLSTVFSEVKKGNCTNIRKALIANEHFFNSDYPSLLRALFNHIYDVETDDVKKKEYLITIAEYLYRSVTMADQELNAFACLTELSSI